MAARLCLVDGTYELFRAFFGAPSRRDAEGAEVGAALALGRSLRALTATGEFTHFAVAFDTVIESFRNELFPGYKTGEGIEPALLSQFALAEEVSRALGFPTFSMVEFEADDGLATLAARFESTPTVAGIVLASPDKDLMQCVRGDRVVTWDRVRNVRYDEAGVLGKHGVPPRAIPDYLALVGDTADGIPGVPKVGAKSAATLLTRYGSVEAIPRSVAEWDVAVRGAAALAESLEAHRAVVPLYKTLATLRTDALPDFALDALELRPDAEALERLEARLGRSLGTLPIKSDQ